MAVDFIEPQRTMIPLEEYYDARDCNMGYCTTCQMITNDMGVEPDAEEYQCYECGEHTVMGVETAFVIGHIVIEEE